MNSKFTLKKEMTFYKQKSLTLCCCFILLFMAGKVHAQVSGALKANPDNVFVNLNTLATFDILKNDALGGCTENEVTVTIVTPPTKALLSGVVPITNRIRYRSQNSVSATRDSLEYQLECSGATSRAWLYINIRNQPNFFYPDVCHVPIPAIGWGMQEVARTDSIVDTVSPILCGDIDNDGEIEIIVFNSTNLPGRRTTAILVFGVQTTPTIQLYEKYKILIPMNSAGNWGMQNLAIANVDGDGYAAIFFATSEVNSEADKQLIKYRFDGTGYVEEWRQNYSLNDYYDNASPLIADFMGSGNVQVQLYDKIYDAKTGTLLVDGGLIPASGRSSFGFGLHGHESRNYQFNTISSADDSKMSSCVAGDIDGDGILELIGGDCVYKINITNYSGTADNSMTLLRRADSRSDVTDGAGVLVDMDGDGQLDVVVVTGLLVPAAVYIYNPRTGVLMNSNIVNDLIATPPSVNGRASMPFIGDLNNDGQPEIALTTSNSMRAYSLSGGVLSELWRVPTTDDSGATTMTLFDFAQSGEAQLVYRDEDSLRIINGVTGNTISVFHPIGSGTANEYPIVVDVDGDGAAEIIAIGANQKLRPGGTGTQWNYLASLRIYASAGAPWAPARKVWNQRTYNPVYVNEDLTIPRHPLNPATFFTRADGSRHQPMNNFLQQATNLNDEGDMLWLGPDLAFDNTRRASIKYDTSLDRLEFTIYVTNKGDAEFSDSLRVSAYVYDTPADLVYKIGHVSLDESVAVGGFKTLTFYIEDYSSLTFPAYWDHWVVVLNGKDNVGNDMPEFPYNANECHYWNNYTSDISFSYGERTMCEGATELFTIIPENTYEFHWYDAEIGGSLLHVGDSKTVTKNSSPIEMYFIDVFSSDGLTKLTAVRDTVYLYLAPDSLIWTGTGGNADWHNANNWFNPNAPVPNPRPNANIPRRCTNVLIPDEIAIYPDLAPSTMISNATVYSESAYLRSECANITFEHGGELARQDSLVYDSAYVHLNLDANRWYMLSAPLRKTFTGDYYEVHPNPHQDSVFVYTRLFSQPNPETGVTAEDAWGWTGSFNSPDYLMKAGEGLSFWVDNKQDIDSISTHPFLFPKYDAFYNIYDWYGNPYATSAALNRGDTITGNPMMRNGLIINPPNPIGKQHRFIYEEVYDPSFGDVLLQVPSTLANDDVIVGNPFMSHLDFDEFYGMNSIFIKNYYRVLDEVDGNFILYTIGGLSTGTPPLTQYIAPMQAFLVNTRMAFPALLANVDMMTGNRPGDKLRSAKESSTGELLSIEVFRGAQANKTLVYYSPDGTDPYGEHINKMFLKNVNKAINVYTTEYANNIPLDFHYLQNLDGVVIPIGIRTSEKGSYRMNFAGLSSFAPGYDIYLTDMEGMTPTSYNIRSGSVFEFEKTSDETFENRRFLLSFQRGTTGIITPEQTMPTIHVYGKDGSVHISTMGTDLLEKVQVYDLQGRQIASKDKIQSPNVEMQVKSGEIYLVRAVSSTHAYTARVYVK